MYFDEEQNRGVSKSTHLEKGQKVIRSEITSLGEMSEFWTHPHNFLKSFKHKRIHKVSEFYCYYKKHLSVVCGTRLRVASLRSPGDREPPHGTGVQQQNPG